MSTSTVQEKFAAYFDANDGSRDWARIEPLFDDLFHDDCVFITADGELGKGDWAEMASRNVAQGISASNFEITADDGKTLSYNVTITMADGEALDLTQKGTISGAQLIRIEPEDPSALSRLVSEEGG